MIDFHSHFLPQIDDGSDSVEMSLAMLKESRRQGVDLIWATPHFYADEDEPAAFLRRRDEAYARLREAMLRDGGVFPKILLGAEILYFPGMSTAEELIGLSMERTPFLLIEPPMMPWSDSMLDEIEETGENLNRLPVIAHIDRYMRILRDDTLFERLEDRRLLIQVNTSFFLNESSREFALFSLYHEMFQFLGSDCHNLADRAPNMGGAARIIAAAGLRNELDAMDQRLLRLLNETPAQ